MHCATQCSRSQFRLRVSFARLILVTVSSCYFQKYEKSWWLVLSSRTRLILSCRFVYESALPVGRLVRDLADKAQVCTQRSWKRPYGVGLLVGGFDKTGAKLYYNCPSGNYYEYKANAVGARSQARTTVHSAVTEAYAYHTNFCLLLLYCCRHTAASMIACQSS